MSTPSDGGPIAPAMFPGQYPGSLDAVGGLSKREHYAAMAMQGIMSNSNHGGEDPSRVACWSFQFADALLAALSASEPTQSPPAASYVMESPLHEVIDQMRWKGGKFVEILSDLVIAADPEKRARLIAAFPEIFARYDAFALLAANPPKP